MITGCFAFAQPLSRITVCFAFAQPLRWITG